MFLGSVYFTLAVTIERYTTVCHPFFKVTKEYVFDAEEHSTVSKHYFLLIKVY